MHFEDLTPYIYGLKSAIGGVRNVGWLELGSPFRAGQCDSRVGQLLTAHYDQLAANRARGFHRCSICARDSVEPSVVVNGESVVLGAAELWVPGQGGEIYAAPDLVIHYLSSHTYLPPDSFVAAVLNLDTVIAGWDAESVAMKLTG
jgi:hypothetical protein